MPSTVRLVRIVLASVRIGVEPRAIKRRPKPPPLLRRPRDQAQKISVEGSRVLKAVSFFSDHSFTAERSLT